MNFVWNLKARKVSIWELSCLKEVNARLFIDEPTQIIPKDWILKSSFEVAGAMISQPFKGVLDFLSPAIYNFTLLIIHKKRLYQQDYNCEDINTFISILQLPSVDIHMKGNNTTVHFTYIF